MGTTAAPEPSTYSELERAVVKAAVGSVLPQALVPVVLDIDNGGARYLDSVLWSLEEKEMSPEEFAAVTCADLKLPLQFGALIAASIREQVQHAAALARHAACRARDGDPLLPRLVVLRVDVVYNGQRFRDDIRWDTTAPRNTPEAVAKQTCSDLSLVKPFDAAVSFAMRRELVRVALGCAAVDARGAPHAAFPATVPRTDALFNAWRPRSGPSSGTAAAVKPQPRAPPGPVPAPPPPAPPVQQQPPIDAAATTRQPPLSSPTDKTQRGSSSTPSEKAPINAYVMFASLQRSRVSTQNPALNGVDVSSVMGELWRNMGAKEREHYEVLARDENARRAAASANEAPPGGGGRVLPPRVAVPPPLPSAASLLAPPPPPTQQHRPSPMAVEPPPMMASSSVRTPPSSFPGGGFVGGGGLLPKPQS